MGRTTRRSGSGQRDSRIKLAEHRLSVLELARELGNVTEACRRRGLELKDLAPIRKSHPQTTSPETVACIKALALDHPAYGCNRLEAILALEGQRVSSITIQKILNDNGLAVPHARGRPPKGMRNGIFRTGC